MGLNRRFVRHLRYVIGNNDTLPKHQTEKYRSRQRRIAEWVSTRANRRQELLLAKIREADASVGLSSHCANLLDPRITETKRISPARVRPTRTRDRNRGQLSILSLSLSLFLTAHLRSPFYRSFLFSSFVSTSTLARRSSRIKRNDLETKPVIILAF